MCKIIFLYFFCFSCLSAFAQKEVGATYLACQNTTIIVIQVFENQTVKWVKFSCAGRSKKQGYFEIAKKKCLKIRFDSSDTLSLPMKRISKRKIKLTIADTKFVFTKIDLEKYPFIEEYLN